MNNTIRAGLIVLFFVSACKPNKHYTAIIKDVSGLEKGSSVVYEGSTVGRILHMALCGDSVAVDFELQKQFRLPLYSTFRIETSILGDSKLVIEKSTYQAVAAPGDTLHETRKVDYSCTFNDTARRRKIKAAAQKMMEGFVELIEVSTKDSPKP